MIRWLSPLYSAAPCALWRPQRPPLPATARSVRRRSRPHRLGGLQNDLVLSVVKIASADAGPACPSPLTKLVHALHRLLAAPRVQAWTPPAQPAQRQLPRNGMLRLAKNEAGETVVRGKRHGAPGGNGTPPPAPSAQLPPDAALYIHPSSLNSNTLHFQSPEEQLATVQLNRSLRDQLMRAGGSYPDVARLIADHVHHMNANGLTASWIALSRCAQHAGAAAAAAASAAALEAEKGSGAAGGGGEAAGSTAAAAPPAPHLLTAQLLSASLDAAEAGKFSVQGICSIVWGVAKVKSTCAACGCASSNAAAAGRLIRRLLESTQPRLFSCTPTDLQRLIWGCATLGVRPAGE